MAVYIEVNNIISSLGFSTEENYNKVLQGISGIKPCSISSLSDTTIPASFIEDAEIEKKFKDIADEKKYTRLEKLAILSVKDALRKSAVSVKDKSTLFILSTTKGNIDLLDDSLRKNIPRERTNLFTTAKVISDFFGFVNRPMLVSNACISGVAAIILAQRLINDGKYDNVVVNGTDILSKFIVSGFQSFMSLSEKPCKPFDKDRDGLTLGEGSATVILTKNKTNIEIVKGATSNDANHISGPSRTGEGLFIAINKTLAGNTDIDYISAHGTATPYNDDMESMAISRTGLEKVPTNSLKGFFGHTLGAAGIIESIICLESLKNNTLLKTVGCENAGTVEKINILQNNETKEIKSLLKVASGFGGSNAAALFVKHE